MGLGGKSADGRQRAIISVSTYSRSAGESNWQHDTTREETMEVHSVQVFTVHVCLSNWITRCISGCYGNGFGRKK